MKLIWCLLMFSAIIGNNTFAGVADFTGEWVVVNDDTSDSGIAGVVTEQQESLRVLQTYPDGTVYIQGIGRGVVPTVEYAFTVIPAGTFFDFAVNGSKLTGSIIRNGIEDPVFDGKISEDKITFTVKEIIQGKTYTYSYTGKLLNDGIQFDVRPPANGGKSFKFKARREPD